jgi:hypothetical protein
MADTDPVAAELAAIREREQAATRGPWGTEEDNSRWQLSGDLDTGFRPPLLIAAPKYDPGYPAVYPSDADAAFIVHARTDLPRLLSAVDKALALHSVVPWYCAASDCEHPEPENDMSDEWQDWDDDHVNGSGGILICRLTIEDSFCPECTHLKYGDEEPEGDDFVSAPCPTRSAVLAGLTGEAGEGA